MVKYITFINGKPKNYKDVNSPQINLCIYYSS